MGVGMSVVRMVVTVASMRQGIVGVAAEFAGAVVTSFQLDRDMPDTGVIHGVLEVVQHVGVRHQVGVLSPVASRVAGLEMGAVLGWMSTRVLGQYDMLVLEEEGAEDQDIEVGHTPSLVARTAVFALGITLQPCPRTPPTGPTWTRAACSSAARTRRCRRPGG